MTLLLLLRSSPAAIRPGGITPGGAVTGPLVRALGGPADPEWTPRTRLAVLERDGTLVGYADESFARSFTIKDDGTGVAKFSLAGDDPAVAYLEHGRLVRFTIDGQARFLGVIRTIDTTEVAQGEEADQIVEVVAPAAIDILAESLVGTSSTTQENPDVRPFSYSAPPGEGSTVIGGTAVAGSALWPGPTPGDWPDPSNATAAPASNPANFPADITAAPGARARWVTGPGTGKLYYLHRFTVADADATHAVDVGMSGPGAVYVDGILVAHDRRQYARRRYSTRHALPAGAHHVAVVVDEPANLAVEPACIVRVSVLDENGQTTASLANSGAPAVAGSTTMGARRSATPPKFLTAGMILAVLIAEAQTRGCFPDLVLSFDAALDTEGNPWTAVAEFSANVGDDSVLAVARKLTEAGYGWFRVAPGQLRLDGYAVRPSTPSVTLAAGVNLAELRHEEAG